MWALRKYNQDTKRRLYNTLVKEDNIPNIFLDLLRTPTIVLKYLTIQVLLSGKYREKKKEKDIW